MKKDLPKVTLLIVVRNERDRIGDALQSLLQQDYPNDKTEIIIIDGMSTDGTDEYIKEQMETHPEIRFLKNPDKILSTGWNIGIKEAKGDYICRIDAHSEICPTYISLGIKELINQKNLAAIGGVISNKGVNKMGKVITGFYASKFGVGNSFFRIGVKKIMKTDTACFGIYPASVFKKVGLFDEELSRNQDLEFHRRFNGTDMYFLTHPQMKITYYVRSSLKKFIKKAHGDGMWTAYSNAYFLRHLIPLFFLIYLIFTAFIVLTVSNNVFVTVAIIPPVLLYFAAALYYGIKDGKTMRSKLLLPFLFLTYHVVYGFGSLKGHTLRLLKVKK